jgi:hypothetical protein
VDYPLHYNAQQFTDKDGNTLITNTDFHATQNLFRFVYYKAQPHTSLWNIVIPTGRVEARNPFTSMTQRSTGVGDVLLSVGYFFIDDKTNNNYLGLGLKVDMPTGSYDKKRGPANMGSNVWRFRPLLALAKLAGPVDLEATFTYDMKTENKDAMYGPFDAKVKEGDRFEVETYAGMFLGHHWLTGIHFNDTMGQDWKVNGIKVKDTGVKVMQLGGSVQWMPTQTFSVMLQCLQDVSPKNSLKGTLFLSRIAYKIF